MDDYNKKEIYVVIATALGRTGWLLERSLPSVYNQSGVDTTKVFVVIADDNPLTVDGYSAEYYPIKNGVVELREKLELKENEFQTIILTNNRTKGNSGTGAWNTGIYFAFEQNPLSYVSVLDDDDEYLPSHLSDCLQEAKRGNNIVAVFQRLFWQNEDGSIMHLELRKEQLQPEAFFRGNPGVQGSNMFFRSDILVNIGAFNELYPNTTDRDLMIRFLWYIEKHIEFNYTISVLESIGVIHHNHKAEKVNTNFALKQKGLDMFYGEYRKHFSEEAYRVSIERAIRFFSYNPEN